MVQSVVKLFVAAETDVEVGFDLRDRFRETFDLGEGRYVLKGSLLHSVEPDTVSFVTEPHRLLDWRGLVNEFNQLLKVVEDRL